MPIDLKSQQIEALEKQVSRCSMIVDGLNIPAWLAICEDYEATRKSLDDSWAYVTDEKSLYKLQVNKMGVLAILNLVDTYKQERERAINELNIIKQEEE